jgi:glycosyltransferase involved in cell wall biosynthesis
MRTKFVLEHATKILPFSEYAKERVLEITKKTNAQVTLLGCDVQNFKPSSREKEALIVTTCYINRDNIKRKGLQTFVKCAEFLKDARFVLIGSIADDSIDSLKKTSPSNVEFTGYISEGELLKWYQRAKVYCQLSYEEGFGVALVEAMACECIPVVSSKAKVLRETVRDNGFYVPYGDVKATVEAIQKALSAPSEMGTKARENVINAFSIKKREKELLALIYETLYK